MRLRQDRRGISNVIVVMLSLVLIIIIAANVVLWSYEMNQFDWERIQEKIEIADAESGNLFSPWFVVQTEYLVEIGSLIGGSYTNTQAVDEGLWETFQEELSPSPKRYRLQINGTFTLDIESYPLDTIQTVEILLRYNVSDIEEKWYLLAYNWTSKAYSRFEGDSGNQPSLSGEWGWYAINLTSNWQSYVRNNGQMYIQIQDENPELPSANKTKLSVDFLGVRLKKSWTSLKLINSGSITVHIVSFWIINSTWHGRYSMNLYVGSGQNATYIKTGAVLPVEEALIKVVTERGNKAVLRNY